MNEPERQDPQDSSTLARQLLDGCAASDAQLLSTVRQAIDLAGDCSMAPARVLLAGFIERLRPALEALGDYDMARDELARIAEQGNGAMRQCRAWRGRKEVADVIDELATATTTFDG